MKSGGKGEQSGDCVKLIGTLEMTFVGHSATKPVLMAAELSEDVANDRGIG